MVTAADSADTANSLREKAQPVIEEATRLLVAEFKPEQVWLFGSYAWGKPTEDSDLDLMVVVQEGLENSLAQAQRARRCLRSIDMAKDVLVKTSAAFDLYRDVRPSLTYKIVREGRLLHGI